MSDRTIRAYNMTGQAENMVLAPFTSSQDKSLPSIAIGNGARGLAGTQMAFAAADGGNNGAGNTTTERTWISWLQTDPGYITQFTASSDALTNWTETHISIAD